MKTFLATVFAFSTMASSHAMILESPDRMCGVKSDALICAAALTISLPTVIIGSDVKEMSEVEKESFLKAEADNYLAGVEGEYVILKITAKSMNSTIEEVAQKIMNQ
jgi:hypothetical protein